MYLIHKAALGGGVGAKVVGVAWDFLGIAKPPLFREGVLFGASPENLDAELQISSET